MARPGITLTMDLTQLNTRIATSFFGAAAMMKTGDAILPMAINKEMAKLKTQFKRASRKWTGIKDTKRIDKAHLITKRASAGLKRSEMRISDYFTKVNRPLFAASWRGKGAPVTHQAWEGGKSQAKAFMIGKTTSFKRVGQGRKAIKPTYGPNIGREVERHQAEGQKMVDVAGARVAVEATRLIGVVLGQGLRRR